MAGAGPSGTPQVATIEDHVTYLARELQKTQGELANAFNLIGTLQSRPSPSASSSPAQGLGGLKPSKPAKFRGDRDDAQMVESWLYSLDRQFIACNTNTDAGRIAYATAMLEKNALDWWMYTERQSAAGGPAAPSTWASFCAALIQRFRPINDERVARDKLLSLRQTGSVAQFATAFQTLLLKVPDISDAERLHRFIAGLKPTIKTQLLISNPKTLEEALEMAERIDHITYSVSGRVAAPVFNRNGPTPMELGALADDEGYGGDEEYHDQPHAEDEVLELKEQLAALQEQLNAMWQQDKVKRPSASAAAPPRRPSRPSDLTPEQRQRCIDERLCFKCFGAGHSARGCRKVRPKVGGAPV